MDEKIDFVILWVDGNDKEWVIEKNKYKKLNYENNSNEDNRYRDWELLKYWFRGVETYAPWVNKIHFVTYGHVPTWLDCTNPKINIVKHTDFIPQEYLPTFNSNVIQYYLKEIPGLSENFVMFDDDQFILKSVKSTDFFKKDKVCDVYGETIIFSSNIGDSYPHCLLNNMQCINQNYSKRKIYKNNLFKYINFKYGLKNNFRTICLFPWSTFVGIYSPHICQAYTKKAYDLFWTYCGKELKKCSYNKFREATDYSTFLVRYIQLLEGQFIPRYNSFGKRIEIKENNKKIYNAITKHKYHILCINDSSMKINYEKTKKELIKCFNQILPNNSSFEK